MDYAVYLLVLGLLAGLGRLPLGLVFRLGSALGLFAWAILPNYRRLARRNIEIAFGRTMTPREIRHTVRRHFQTLGANLLSAPRLARLPEKAVQARVDLVGLSHLRAALDRGHGVVLAINHIGNWELYAQLIGQVRNVPAGTIFQSLSNKYLNKLIDRDRRRLGLKTFDRGRGYLDAIKLVERGGVLAVLIDQYTNRGLWTPLFKRLAGTSPLSAIIAKRTKAPLISVAIYTTGIARWRCEIHPPVDSCHHSVEDLTLQLNRNLEKQIGKSPADWFWVHNRWKTPRSFLLGKTRRGFHISKDEDPSDLQPFRLLVRSSNWLGDAVMSIPAVEACKKGRPDLHLVVLTPAKLAPLWQRVSAVDEVLAIESGTSPLKLAHQLRHTFDAAILFPNSLRSALEARLLGIPRIVGYPGYWRRWLLSQQPKSAPESCEHHANRFMRLVVHCGAPSPTEPPTFNRRTLQRTPARMTPRIGICPGAEYGPAKRWPAERFAAAMQAFHATTPAEYVLFGVAGDVPAGKIIAAACPFPVENRIGRTSLDELMDELAACDALLTNDTGTMHLAAFLGVPTVAIFGSTEPDLTAPLGDFHHVLRRKVDCSPCFRRECPIDFRCMTGIEPAEAAAALREVVARDCNCSGGL